MNEFQRRLMDVVEANTAVYDAIDHKREVLLVEPYCYAVDFNNTIASGVQLNPATPRSFNLIMDSDSDFVLTHMNGGCGVNQGTATAGGAQRIQANPAVLLQITDRSSGRTFFDIPTIFPLVAGWGGFPFIFTSPRVIKPRSTLQLDFTVADTSGAGANYYGVYAALWGAKIFYKS